MLPHTAVYTQVRIRWTQTNQSTDTFVNPCPRTRSGHGHPNKWNRGHGHDANNPRTRVSTEPWTSPSLTLTLILTSSQSNRNCILTPIVILTSSMLRSVSELPYTDWWFIWWTSSTTRWWYYSSRGFRTGNKIHLQISKNNWCWVFDQCCWRNWNCRR